jgi:hypothetical protein
VADYTPRVGRTFSRGDARLRWPAPARARDPTRPYSDAVTEEQPDAWGELGARYEHDEDAQFFLVVEQLAEIRALVRSDEVAKLRMALVAIDNLAEVLLHRQKRIAQRIANEGWTHRVPRLGAKELRRFSADFGARVQFARRGGGDYLSDRVLRPLLDDLDDAIVRTGHAYRNRVYHADHHNSLALPLIARTYMAAVGRAFARHQPRQIAHSVGEWQRQALAEYGYDVDGESWAGRGMFEPVAAAEAIVARLTDDLQLDLAEVNRQLTADLAWRCDWADGMIENLLSEGMAEKDLNWALAWGQFWDARGSDDELVRLATEQADAWHEIVQSDDKGEARFDHLHELQEKHSDRVRELLRDFTPNLDLGEIDRVRKAGEKLSTARDLGRVFTRYQALDERIQKIERALDDAAIGWDRAVQEELDRRRGK